MQDLYEKGVHLIPQDARPAGSFFEVLQPSKGVLAQETSSRVKEGDFLMDQTHL